MTTTTTAPKGMDTQDWNSAVNKGEYRGYSIYRSERAGGCPNRRHDELVTWWAVKGGEVVAANDTRKHLLAGIDMTLDMTDEQRAMRDRVLAGLANN